MVKNIIICVLVIVGVILGVMLSLSSKNEHQQIEPKEPGHKAYHEGSINAISECAVGHAEIKVTDSTFDLWFVGGDQDTNRAVRIQADKVELSVFLPDGTNKEIALPASPLELAGEKIGDCSHFAITADWLKEVKEFKAIGKILFKGKVQPLIIQYPKGYDPD